MGPLKLTVTKLTTHHAGEQAMHRDTQHKENQFKFDWMK